MSKEQASLPRVQLFSQIVPLHNLPKELNSARNTTTTMTTNLPIATTVLPLSTLRPPSASSLNDRKRAIRRAEFFAECHLRGVSFSQACTVMKRADEEYDKWWVQATASKKRSRSEDEDDKASSQVDNCARRDTARPIERISLIKERLIARLVCETDTSDESLPNIDELIDQLSLRFQSKRWVSPGGTSPRYHHHQAGHGMEGLWLTISKPTFPNCLGRTEEGHWRYELGRLAFDRFRPNKLLCSIVHVVNNISDQYEVMEHGRVVRRRRYDIVSSFVIEPQQLGKFKVEKPIHGLLTTQGHCEPDPSTRNRLTISFTGGLLELQNPQDLDAWKDIFQPVNPELEKGADIAAIIADKFLLGAESKPMQHDGTIHYTMRRPIGGQHGQVYVDVLYMDHSMRIQRGHHGTLFVSMRVPEEDDVVYGDPNATPEQSSLLQIG